MSQDKEREAFEAAYRTQYQFASGRPGKFDRDERGDYEDTTVRVAWWAWKATQPPAVQGEPVAWMNDEGAVVSKSMADKYPEYRHEFRHPLFASPPSREPQWQPIETAPEETDVLLWLADGRPPAVAALFNGDWTSFDGRIYAPTHWMPLPPPPGIHSREGGSK